MKRTDEEIEISTRTFPEYSEYQELYYIHNLSEFIRQKAEVRRVTIPLGGMNPTKERTQIYYFTADLNMTIEQLLTNKNPIVIEMPLQKLPAPANSKYLTPEAWEDPADPFYNLTNIAMSFKFIVREMEGGRLVMYFWRAGAFSHMDFQQYARTTDYAKTIIAGFQTTALQGLPSVTPLNHPELTPDIFEVKFSTTYITSPYYNVDNTIYTNSRIEIPKIRTRIMFNDPTPELLKGLGRIIVDFFPKTPYSLAVAKEFEY